MNTGKAVLAVLAGVAAGAALGILFAPDKGSETRKKAIRKGKDLTNLINQEIDAKVDRLVTKLTGKPKASASAKKDVAAEPIEIAG